MVSRGYGQNSWYLTSVQAGFEPWVNGTGLTVNTFTYSIGGNRSPTPTRTVVTDAFAAPTRTNSPTRSPTSGGGGACRVSYVRQQWTGGFTTNLTITNTGLVHDQRLAGRLHLPG